MKVNRQRGKERVGKGDREADADGEIERKMGT